MKRTLILGIGFVGALGIATAVGQPGGRGAGDCDGGERRGPHGPGPVVRALDADQDGAISSDEIAGAPDLLATLDSDGDGALSRADLRPPRPSEDAEQPNRKGRRGQRGRHGSPPLDTDSNGTVSLEEFLAPAQSHFQELDTDGDGSISLEEFLAAPTEQFSQLDDDGDGEINPPMSRRQARPSGRKARSNRGPRQR